MPETLPPSGVTAVVRDDRLRRFRGGAFWAAALAMAVVALARWYTAIFLLVVSSEPRAAVDLLQRWEDTRAWFAGAPVWSMPDSGPYPPQAFLVLWPLLGWLSPTAARWLWAVLLLASLAWLIVLLVRASGAERAKERTLVVLLVLSAQATTLVIANGQLAILLLPPLLAAGLLAFRRPGRLRDDLAIAGFALFALCKPTISAPFCWVYLLCASTLVPGLMIGIGYVALTVAAMAFQPGPLGEMVRDLTVRARSLDAGWGYGSLHSLFAFHGLPQWTGPAALVALAALGVWVYRHRRCDPWLVLSVAALVARFWSYHQIYDDVLMLVPLAFLFGWFGQHRGHRVGRIAVAAVLASASFTLVAPGRWYLLPDSAEPVLNTVRTTVWLAVAAAVLLAARSGRSRTPGPEEIPSPTTAEP